MEKPIDNTKPNGGTGPGSSAGYFELQMVRICDAGTDAYTIAAYDDAFEEGSTWVR